MKLTDFTPGTRVYSARYKTYGTVDHPAKKLVHVTMDNTGKVRPLAVSDLSIVTETVAQRVFRQDSPMRLKSTTIRPGRPGMFPVNARRRRAMRHADVSSMMLRRTP